jgi:hypothetical protein
MHKKSPFQVVQDQHGSKEQLVDKVVDVIERGDESKDDLKTRLQTSSNAKLLRLLEIASAVQERFGSKEKLVDAILALQKRAKDADYRKKLLSYSPTRLLDMHRSKDRAHKAAGATPASA